MEKDKLKLRNIRKTERLIRELVVHLRSMVLTEEEAEFLIGNSKRIIPEIRSRVRENPKITCQDLDCNCSNQEKE